MIWLVLFTAYCFLCAAWALCEARERRELSAIVKRRLNGLGGKK